MKVLFLPESYFPYVSGVPVVVRYLAEGLAKRGHEVSVATCTFKDCPSEETIENVHVYRFYMKKNSIHLYIGDIHKYISFVKKFNADITIFECSQCITTDVLLPHLKEIPGKKIFHSHGFSGLELKPFQIKGDILHSLGNTWNWFASKWYFSHTLKNAMPFFDASLCLSEVDSSREYLKAHIVNSFVLDNAADNMFFAENIVDGALKKYATITNNKYIMCCANYTVVKNQKDMLVQYYKSESSRSVSFVCIGSQKTPYYYECVELNRELMCKYGNRDVHLLQGVNRKDIPSIMKGATLYLVTSRYEQYSISIIEAMSQGLPFISMNTGNARILPGGVSINNVDDMHKEIDYLLANKVEHERYSAAGREFAYKNCRVDAVVDKLESIIKSIV